jgi:hypothetical protein
MSGPISASTLAALFFFHPGHGLEQPPLRAIAKSFNFGRNLFI